MRQRVAFSILLISLLLSACAPSAPAAGTRTPAPPSAVPTDATDDSQRVEPIPVHVGYGGKGSFFEIYFTDPANPASKQQTGGIEQALIASIDAARLSVDVAIYSFSLREVGNALLRARDRGVTVRVVMESDNRERSLPQALIEAGLPILGDRREGLMHDKFVVIDRAEVWTGSLNFTPSGVYEDNNNLAHIRSVKIAENYLAEFNEMYEDDLFGPDTRAATPNPVVTVEGTRVETFFSPDDGVAARVLELLQGARKSVHFLAYSFTADDLAEVLRAKHSEGLTIKGVMDGSQIASNKGTEFDPFRQAGIDVRKNGNKGLMHHKVIIIDRSIVITGSYNFTGSAEDRNDENLLIIFSPDIAKLYLDEFNRVFKAAQPASK